MPPDSGLDFRIVDLSDQRLEARVWRPALDAFDRPAGAKVYHDLIGSISLRLGCAHRKP